MQGTNTASLHIKASHMHDLWHSLTCLVVSVSSTIRKGLVPGHRGESTQEIGLTNHLFNFLFLASFFYRRQGWLSKIATWKSYSASDPDTDHDNFMEPCVLLCCQEGKTVMALIWQKFWLFFISLLNVPTILWLCSNSSRTYQRYLKVLLASLCFSIIQFPFFACFQIFTGTLSQRSWKFRNLLLFRSKWTFWWWFKYSCQKE